MAQSNLGLCNGCRARVPSEFVFRDGEVWIRKRCPSCGPNESLVSSDASVWQAKRDLWQYVPADRVACTLHCDRCRVDHTPTIVFVDVTNRCNMHCPICIATIRGMGFDFNPPLEYFEKIFAEVSRMEPKPMVELFGGEPTVRDDLLEIIAIGRKHRLKPRVVTNGLRLADEEYCRELCASRVRVRFAFDGRSPDIYERLRHNRAAYEKKLKGLANLKKYSKRKHAIIACAAWGINDQYIGDLIQCCHENMDIIAELGIIPLTENWKPGDFDAGVRTTMEGVEKMVQQSVPGGEVEFIPAGLTHSMRKPRSFFRKRSRSETLLLGGVHPNCESITLLISDGQQYRSVNHFLKMRLSEAAAELVARSRKIDAKLTRLDPTKFLHRLRGQYLTLKTYGPVIARMVDIRRICKGNPILDWAKILLGLMLGRRFRDLAYKHLRPPRILRVAVLPFEEYHSIDAARMENCKAVFAYEDAKDGKVKTIPACTWYYYRNPLLAEISQKYGVVGNKGGAETPATV